jgi:hypothetical protein
MTGRDNAIVRSVPLLRSDGGMMEAGWGEPPAFPPIEVLTSEQRRRLTFAMIPPSLTLVFAPNTVAYQMISAAGVEKTYASNDRITAGGWIVPRTTRALSDFDRRAAAVQEGAKKIWAQDIPVNLGVQSGKKSRYVQQLRIEDYGPLERTLLQFNAWLVHAYRSSAERLAA